ncbi:MAG: ABC transporter permease [Parvibaculum sp.]|nr:ABC transporter permease [Parvibaculum sp.]MBO6678605.1 ABC transporter permease [Parvibaculum sp.]MBO6685636.1 ABC transporter permease [Parvibaculum sp.]MBO6905477.1 ABC transporter permease [Parvibaculum sp.]
MEWLSGIQGWIHQSVRNEFSAFAAAGDWTAVLAILPLGLVFGMVHALTPGHGKMLLASYLVGSRLSILRGLAVSSILAATHVLSAVVIALVATELLSRGLAGAGRAPALEWVSRGILVMVGLWFLVQAIAGADRHMRHEGAAFGIVAGLVPCPLTLFAMIMASARGVPEAGLGFAAAMVLGIAITLGAVAVLAVAGRAGFAELLARYGAPTARLSRSLTGASGLLLATFGLYELAA